MWHTLIRSPNALRIETHFRSHEYFHNWSGNRVTVRDWFQLSLSAWPRLYFGTHRVLPQSALC